MWPEHRRSTRTSKEGRAAGEKKGDIAGGESLDKIFKIDVTDRRAGVGDRGSKEGELPFLHIPNQHPPPADF